MKKEIIKNKKYDNLIIPHITTPSFELTKSYISKIIQNPDDYYKLYNFNLDILFDIFLPTTHELKELIVGFDLPELQNYFVEYYDFFELGTIQSIQFYELSEKIQSGISDEKIYISSRPTVLFFPDLDWLSIKMRIDISLAISIWVRTGTDKNKPYTFIHKYKNLKHTYSKTLFEYSNLYRLMKSDILPLYLRIQENKKIEYLDTLIFEYFQNNFFNK
jgi:hypothetical protein